MSRTLFFPLLCLILLCCSTRVSAQRAVISADQSRGSFQISDNKVHYSITAAYPDNITLQMQPQSDFFLKAHIVNAEGQEVLPIKQEPVSMRYASSLDVATLKPGKYYIEVFTSDQNSHYRMAFQIAKQ